MTDKDMQELDPQDMFLFGARAAVAQRGTYLLLILDEIEAVWKQDPHERPATDTRRSLGDEAFALMWHLANTGHGGVGTLICGSTASVDRLIKGLPVDGFLERRSLNGTKFPLTRIVPAEPTDPKAAAEFVKKMRPDLMNHENPTWCQLMTEFVHWSCGANPRKAAAIIAHCQRSKISRKDYESSALEVVHKGRGKRGALHKSD